MARLLPIILIAASYLIGSIPFSYLVGRVFAGADIRHLGSGNVGATNVMRNFGKWPGIIALLLDIGKGWLAVALAIWLVNRPDWPLPVELDTHGSPLSSPAFWRGLAGLLAVVAHMFPIWLRFQGGKGATAAGVFLALDPLSLLFAAGAFALALVTFRYVSLASMMAAAAVPLAMRFISRPPFWVVVMSVLISFVVIVKHYQNISRLAQGTERKLGQRKEDP